MANKKITYFLTHVLVIGVVIFLLASIAKPVYRQMGLSVRIDYAISEITGLQDSIKQFFEKTGRIPLSVDELPGPHHIHYPDGGGAKFEDDGVIQIYFEFEPELKAGNIYYSPVVKNGELLWKCTATGEELLKIVSNRCRGDLRK